MLIHSNATISVSRFSEIAGVKTRAIVKTGYAVYIQSRAEKVVNSIDSQGAYKEFLCMTDGLFDLKIGDKLTWGSRNFVVNAGEKFSDLTGAHGEYIIYEVYD